MLEPLREARRITRVRQSGLTASATVNPKSIERGLNAQSRSMLAGASVLLVDPAAHRWGHSAWLFNQRHMKLRQALDNLWLHNW